MICGDNDIQMRALLNEYNSFSDSSIKEKIAFDF